MTHRECSCVGGQCLNRGLGYFVRSWTLINWQVSSYLAGAYYREVSNAAYDSSNQLREHITATKNSNYLTFFCDKFNLLAFKMNKLSSLVWTLRCFYKGHGNFPGSQYLEVKNAMVCFWNLDRVWHNLGNDSDTRA